MEKIFDEILAVDWENVCEEDFLTLRREKNTLPRLIYLDTEGNVYHFVKRGEADGL